MKFEGFKPEQPREETPKQIEKIPIIETKEKKLSSVEVPGFIATLLRYGNLRIQTAGEQSFVAHNIPHIDKVKNIILAEMRKHHKG